MDQLLVIGNVHKIMETGKALVLLFHIALTGKYFNKVSILDPILKMEWWQGSVSK